MRQRNHKEVEVLGENDAIATIAVKDIAVSKRFYEGTLGLRAAWFQDPDGNILALVSR